MTAADISGAVRVRGYHLVATSEKTFTPGDTVQLVALLPLINSTEKNTYYKILFFFLFYRHTKPFPPAFPSPKQNKHTKKPWTNFFILSVNNFLYVENNHQKRRKRKKKLLLHMLAGRRWHFRKGFHSPPGSQNKGRSLWVHVSRVVYLN